MNLTHDGYHVPDPYHLRFSLFTIEHFPDVDIWWPAMSIEWNTENTRKRPYLVLDLGPWLIQSGWLWSTRIKTS